jgi:hypothetical protein
MPSSDVQVLRDLLPLEVREWLDSEVQRGKAGQPTWAAVGSVAPADDRAVDQTRLGTSCAEFRFVVTC